MYMQVPPPITLIDLETGKPLSDENVTDDKGRTFKSLGIPYENKPIPMRRWWLRNLAPLYKGYSEMKAAKRTEKKLKHAEEVRDENNLLPVEDIGGDTELLKKKAKEWADKVGYDVLMQFEAFLDAIEKMSEEEPKVGLQAVS